MSSVFHRLPSTLNGLERMSFRLRPQLRPQPTRQLTLFSRTSRSPEKPWTTYPNCQSRHISDRISNWRYWKRPPGELIFPGLRKFKWQGTAKFVEAFKEEGRKHPYQMTAVLFFIIFGLAFSAKMTYDQASIAPSVSKYPPGIRADLRKALYFSDYAKDPVTAMRFWERAWKKLRESNYDVFTPEILYLKVKFVQWMVTEFKDSIFAAIGMLEVVMSDNERWMKERFEPGKERQRKDVLLANVRIANKLAEFYADEHVLEYDKAEQKLVYAVETIMREHQRRQEEGVKEGEGDWISDDEFVAMLEQTAHHFESRNNHYFAAPLFLQAITKADPKSCHMAVLMNNLSICLAQQVVPQAPGEKAIPRSTQVSNARAWSIKALEIAAKIQPPNRTEECDVGCAVATHNLGEFAEMDGNIAEARKRYEEAKSLAKAIGFNEGVAAADIGIERISKKTSKKG